MRTRGRWVWMMLLAFAGCDGGSDLDPAQAVRCAGPTRGQMVVAEEGEVVTVTLELDDPARIASLRVNGEPAPVAAAVEVALPARFGMNHVVASAETADGIAFDRVCTFLAAPDYHAADEPLDDAVTMRLGPAAVDDLDDDATELRSLTDLFRRFFESGAPQAAIDLYFRASGAPVKPMECDRTAPDGVTCELETRLDYRGITIGGYEEGHLTPIDDGMSFLGRSREVTVDVRLVGTVDPFGAATPISGDGTLRFAYFEAAGEVDLFATGGLIEAPLRRLTGIDVGEITASFPSISDPTLRADVEDEIVGYYVGSSGESFTNGFAEFLLANVSGLIEGLLRTISVRTLGAEVDVPRLDGEVTGLAFASSFSSVAASPDGITFGLGTRYGGVGAGASTLGVPLAGSFSSVSDTTMPVGNRVSEGALNFVLHGHWLAGGLDAIVAPSMIVAPDMIVAPSMIVAPDMIVAPSMIVAPDMIVAPSMIEVESSLPVVARALEAGEVELMLGGMTLRLSGGEPYGDGLVVHLGATARGRLAADAGEDPTYEAFEITELVYDTSPPLNGPDRPGVYAFLVAYTHHVASFSMNEAGPTLPLPSLQTTAEFSVGGVPTGTELGTAAPTVSLGEGYLDVAGGFAER